VVAKKARIFDRRVLIHRQTQADARHKSAPGFKMDGRFGLNRTVSSVLSI
jgi:hypothetical protein